MFPRLVSSSSLAIKRLQSRRMAHSLPYRRSLPTGELHRDLCVLVEFVEFYCAKKHKRDIRTPLALKSPNMKQLAGHEVNLCGECAKLLTHAVVKRSTCPLDPKPQCKHCLQHCYHPKYRELIQEVMRFSGMGLIVRGRLGFLTHWLF